MSLAIRDKYVNMHQIFWQLQYRRTKGLTTVTNLRKILLGLISVGTMLFLSSCDKMEVFHPKGMIARDERNLLITAVLLMLTIVIPVIIATFVIAYRYRASNKKAKYDPDFTHSVKLELIWWALPIIIIAILGTITWKSTHRLDPYRPIDSNVQPVIIQAISLQWRWLFIYPDQGIATMNYVEFPANTPISFQITSDAPMNSFLIEQLAGQIYAMAGMRTKLHLIADEPGVFNGRSVSFSGDGFANMAFEAKAVTNTEFNQWVNSVKQSPNTLDMNAYNKLVPATHDTSVMYFKLADTNLFNEVIMKFMGPDVMEMNMDQKHMDMPNMKELPSTDANGEQLKYHEDRDYDHHKGYYNSNGEYKK